MPQLRLKHAEQILDMKTLTLLLLCVSIVGCATVGRKLDQSSVDRIQKGKTSQQEVLAWLGSPDQIMRINGMETFSYRYVRAAAKPATYIPIVGAFAGGVNMQQQVVVVAFDEAGIVRNIVSNQGGTESGYGLSSGSAASIPAVEANKRPQ